MTDIVTRGDGWVGLTPGTAWDMRVVVTPAWDTPPGSEIVLRVRSWSSHDPAVADVVEARIVVGPLDLPVPSRELTLGPGDQLHADATPRFFAWDTNKPAAPRRVDVYVKPRGGRRVRVNAREGSATLGSFIDGTDRFVYAEGPSEDRDVYVYDVGSAKRWPLRGASTEVWSETYPAASKRLVEFLRFDPGYVGAEIRSLDRVTGEARTLASSGACGYGSCDGVGAGAVDGPFVTYEYCPLFGRCEAWIYDARSGNVRTVPHNGGPAVVDPRTSVAYFSVSLGTSRDLVLVRWDLNTQAFRPIADLEDHQPFSMQLAHRPDGHLDLYLSQWSSETRSWGIFTIPDVDAL